jgi:hypothetical protein
LLGAALAIHGCDIGLFGEPCQPPIVRGDPQDQHLDDERYIVIDTGERHEPELNNYDHHQNEDLPAAFLLVAEAMGIRGLMEEAVPWAQFWSTLDRKGPQTAAQQVGVSGNISALINPLGQWPIGHFSASTRVDPHRGSDADSPAADSFYDVLLDIGEQKFEQAVQYQQRRREVEEKLELVTERSPALPQEKIKLAFLEEEPDKKIMRELGVELGLDFSITENTQGGWCLYSYKRSGVDLTEHEVGLEPEFVHPEGFMMVLPSPGRCVDALETIIQ